MNLLDKLWKPATDIKPESLIGKQCRNKKSGRVLLIERYSDMFSYYVCRTSEGYIKHCFAEEIEYLDESPEAVKEAMKPLYRKIKDYVISLDTPDNTVYQENSLLIQSCFAKALELIEEFESI